MILHLKIQPETSILQNQSANLDPVLSICKHRKSILLGANTGSLEYRLSNTALGKTEFSWLCAK